MVRDECNDGQSDGCDESVIDAHQHFRDLERNYHSAVRWYRIDPASLAGGAGTRAADAWRQDALS